MFDPTKIQVDATRNPADGEAHLPYLRVASYVNADGGVTIREVATPSHPVIVRKVTHIVDTGFGASAPADVGDGTTADLWIANTAITENTAGDVASSTIGGKKYTAAFQVKVTLGGTRTGGAGTLMVEMVRL